MSGFFLAVVSVGESVALLNSRRALGSEHFPNVPMIAVGVSAIIRF
jgi:hypothetical protein